MSLLSLLSPPSRVSMAEKNAVKRSLCEDFISYRYSMVWISSKLILIGSEPYYTTLVNSYLEILQRFPRVWYSGVSSPQDMHIGGYVFIFQINLNLFVFLSNSLESHRSLLRQNYIYAS